MADLIEAFPEFAPSTVMLIATIPGLFMIFPSLFTVNFRLNLHPVVYYLLG